MSRHFRAFKSAVSLKQGDLAAGAFEAVLFPRLQKRGLIEALTWRVNR